MSDRETIAPHHVLYMLSHVAHIHVHVHVHAGSTHWFGKGQISTNIFITGLLKLYSISVYNIMYTHGHTMNVLTLNYLFRGQKCMYIVYAV